MPIHCPICNRSSTEAHFYGEFCEFCTVEKLGDKLPETIKITVCKRCGRYKCNGIFVEGDKNVMQELFQKKFKDFDLKLVSYKPDGAIIKLNKYEDNIEGITREVAIVYYKTMCPKCNRQSAGYYEGVVQLRGYPDRVQKIFLKLEKYLTDHDEFIARTENVGNGVNVFVSSKRCASAFCSERGLKPLMSYELYGERRGKRLYRNTYSLHFD